MWKSQGCCLKYPWSGQTHVVFFRLPFSNLVATIVVSIFCSGNAIFFVKEIWPDLLIASDTEFLIVLFTGPKIIQISIQRHHQMQNQHQNQTKNCRQQTATQTNKQIKITWPIIFLIKLFIISVKQASFFLNARRFIGLFCNRKVVPDRDFWNKSLIYTHPW